MKFRPDDRNQLSKNCSRQQLPVVTSINAPAPKTLPEHFSFSAFSPSMQFQCLMLGIHPQSLPTTGFFYWLECKMHRSFVLNSLLQDQNQKLSFKSDNHQIKRIIRERSC